MTSFARVQETFKDIKEVNRNRTSKKTDNTMAKEVIRSRTSKKTDNIMDKGKLTKDRQYHGQREADKNTDNIMAKGKLTKIQTIS